MYIPVSHTPFSASVSHTSVVYVCITIPSYPLLYFVIYTLLLCACHNFVKFASLVCHTCVVVTSYIHISCVYQLHNIFLVLTSSVCITFAQLYLPLVHLSFVFLSTYVLCLVLPSLVHRFRFWAESIILFDVWSMLVCCCGNFSKLWFCLAALQDG